MRRALLLALIAGVFLSTGSGCSQAKKTRRVATSNNSSKKPIKSRPLPKLGGSPTGGSTKLRDVSGPKTLAGVGTVDLWKKDLSSSSAEKRILAANELGAMGSTAKSALAELQALAKDRNPQVAAAAKSAIARIGR